MQVDLIRSADTVGLFCRLHMNNKRDIPIRPSEMGVLIFTQKQSVHVTPLMVSQFFKIAKPSVTAIINALVHQDYLKKVPSIDDKRSYTLRVTEKGSQLVESTFVEYFKSIELLKDNMGDDRFNQLIDLIRQANSILEEKG